MNPLNLFAAPDGITDPSNPAFGLKVVMQSVCPKCRNRLAIIGPGEGPHTASLTCTRCRHARGWLAKQETDFINKIISTFGRPTAPIVLRRKLRRPVPSGASLDADPHQNPEDITVRDDFPDHDPDTPTENDLDLAYGSKYLGTTDLGSRKVRARIEKVRKQELTDNEGPKKMKFIIFFDALDKPLVLNTTNKDELVRELGRVPANWIGAIVGLFVDPNTACSPARRPAASG